MPDYTPHRRKALAMRPVLARHAVTGKLRHVWLSQTTARNNGSNVPQYQVGKTHYSREDGRLYATLYSDGRYGVGRINVGDKPANAPVWAWVPWRMPGHAVLFILTGDCPLS